MILRNWNLLSIIRVSKSKVTDGFVASNTPCQKQNISPPEGYARRRIFGRTSRRAAASLVPVTGWSRTEVTVAAIPSREPKAVMGMARSLLKQVVGDFVVPSLALATPAGYLEALLKLANF